MGDEPKRLPDSLEAIARELALLERRRYTLTGPERSFLDTWRSGGAPDLIARRRRAKFRLIDGGRE